MPYSAKNKHGLVYKPPGNTDRARTHEDVESNRPADGVTCGLSYKEVFNEDELERNRMEELFGPGDY